MYLFIRLDSARRCRLLAEARQSSPRRITSQRFAANGVEPDLVGVAFSQQFTTRRKSGFSKGSKRRSSEWAARASALVWGGSQPVAKPSTIWYRARGKQKCTALPRRGTHRA